MTVSFDGVRFTVGRLHATLDDVARVYFHHIHVRYRGLAALAQPFLGGVQGTIRVVLSDGREASERVRGAAATEAAKRLADEAALRAGANDLARLRAGETLDYGPVGVSTSGIRLKKKVIPWSEVTGYRLYQGALMVDRGRKLAATIWLSRIANLAVFLRVLAEAAPGLDYERMPPNERPKGSLLFPSAATRDPRYPTFRARMAVLSLTVIWIPPYLLFIVPFALHHRSTSEATRVIRARVLEPAYANVPPSDAPLPTPFGEGCPVEPIAPEEIVAVARDRLNAYARATVSREYAVPTGMPRRLPGPVTFADSYSRLLYEVPTDWPLGGPDERWTAVHWTLVVNEVAERPRPDPSGPVFATTLTNVRLLQDGAPVCEGALEIDELLGSHAWGPAVLALGALATQCPRLGRACEDLGARVAARPVSAETALPGG